MENCLTPIHIFRGDDTSAFGLRTLTIKLTGDLDLTNATAKFTLLGFSKVWTNAETRTGELTMSFSRADTEKFPLGPQFGTLRLYDINGATDESLGKRLTVVNTIPFEVTNRVFGAPTEEYNINVALSVDTEINITFTTTGSESEWGRDPSGKFLTPIDPTITKVLNPALDNVNEIGERYTLADVKNLVNTLLNSFKA